MEGELFSRLYQHVMALAIKPRARETYSDAVILLVHFWAVLHDRPTNWACRQENWPIHQRRWAKPSPSRMCRRLRHPDLRELAAELQRRLRAAPADAELVKCIDGKPLTVSPYSRDKQATWGYVGKGVKSRGYKLFALADRHGVLHWEVHGLGTGELEVAKRLLPKIDGAGYVLGDALYDTNTLHGLAGVCNHRLITPRKKPGTGLGNREHSPNRLRCIELMEDLAPHDNFGVELYKQRTQIERTFGHMTAVAGGLGPLPAWVRTLPRVRRWVQAKILIQALRLRP